MADLKNSKSSSLAKEVVDCLAELPNNCVFQFAVNSSKGASGGIVLRIFPPNAKDFSHHATAIFSYVFNHRALNGLVEQMNSVLSPKHKIVHLYYKEGIFYYQLKSQVSM